MCRHRPVALPTKTLFIRRVPTELHQRVLAARDQLERDLGIHVCADAMYRRLLRAGMDAVNRDKARALRRLARKVAQ